MFRNSPHGIKPEGPVRAQRFTCRRWPLSMDYTVTKWVHFLIRSTRFNRSCVALHKTHTALRTQNKTHQKTTSVCKGVGKAEPLCVASPAGKRHSCWGFLDMWFFKKGIKICVSKSITHCVPPRTESRHSSRYLYTALGNIPNNKWLRQSRDFESDKVGWLSL